MTPAPVCARCGAPLKPVPVKLPVKDQHGRVIRYQDAEELSDCVRCTGAY